MLDLYIYILGYGAESPGDGLKPPFSYDKILEVVMSGTFKNILNPLEVEDFLKAFEQVSGWDYSQIGLAIGLGILGLGLAYLEYKCLCFECGLENWFENWFGSWVNNSSASVEAGATSVASGDCSELAAKIEEGLQYGIDDMDFGPSSEASEMECVLNNMNNDIPLILESTNSMTVDELVELAEHLVIDDCIINSFKDSVGTNILQAIEGLSGELFSIEQVSNSFEQISRIIQEVPGIHLYDGVSFSLLTWILWYMPEISIIDSVEANEHLINIFLNNGLTQDEIFDGLKTNDIGLYILRNLLIDMEVDFLNPENQRLFLKVSEIVLSDEFLKYINGVILHHFTK